MKKDIKIQTAREGIKAASSAGIETGAFFILGYPGESNETILDTIDFAISLPLDYVSFTLPYPIPGTGLHMKLKNALKSKKSHGMRLINQRLEFDSEFSESKLKFAIIKAALQFKIMKFLGRSGYKIFGQPFSWFTDKIFRVLR
jgi:anaerobic magnesium-protoporphyrin IX monomethyl ester cyclase